MCLKFHKTFALEAAALRGEPRLLFFGKKLKISSGLAPGDRIILNPPDSLYAGQGVQVIDTDVDLS